MRWFLVISMALFAVTVGVAAALFGGLLVSLLVVPLLVLIFVLSDYRVGVVTLAFLLPWTASPLLPQAQGLNIINYLVAVSVLSFGIRAVFSRRPVVHVPRAMIWFYLVPLTIGVVLSVSHLSEAARNYAGTEEALAFGMSEFLKSRYLKPLGLVIFAFLLANAVKDSKRPERFVVAFVLAGALPSLVVFALIAVYKVSLSDLQAQRSFMGPIGLHANEMAIMLAFVVGPMLFLLPSWRSVVTRFFAGLALAAMVLALLLTFSRGGFLALTVIVIMFMVQQRRVLVLLAGTAVLAIAVLVAPSAIKERLFTGVEQGAIAYSVGNLNDPLTAGRIAVWEKLAPEVMRSPLWGRGLSSTAWSDLVRSGRYRATHPHNLYLAILMDLGVLGLAAMLYWYWVILRAQNFLRNQPEVDPLLRQFFAGSMASFAGVLVMSVTNGNYYPKPEYTFFWFSLGILFAYWPGEPSSRHRPSHARANMSQPDNPMVRGSV